MTFREFKETNEVKAMINEILKHDVNNSIISIGLADYHLTPEKNITSGDGGIDLYVFTDRDKDSRELSNFISDFDAESQNIEHSFAIYDEVYADMSNTRCHTIYAA